MRNWTILALILCLGMMTCIRIKQYDNTSPDIAEEDQPALEEPLAETSFERECSNYRLEDNFTFMADCTGTEEALELDLTECMGARNGILEHPSRDLDDFCERCELKEFNLECSCSRDRLDEDSTAEDEEEEDAEIATEANRELTLSYFDLRQVIRLENNELRC